MQSLESSFSNMEFDSLQPTYIGPIESEVDAFLVVSACLSRRLSLVTRLPNGREQDKVVRNGNTYVYSEVGTGQGEWQDGKEWSKGQWEHGLLIQNHNCDKKSFIKISGTLELGGVVHRLISYREVVERLYAPFKDGCGKSILLTTPSRDDNFKTDLVGLGLVGFRPQPHSRRPRST